MKTSTLFLAFISVIIFSSCENKIQVKLDEGAPLVTIDGFVNDMRQAQKIRVTYADNYFSQKPSEPIKGATVVVKDITTGRVYNFTDNNNGDYSFDVNATNDTIGFVGHDYELSVTHQGTIFKSTSTLNRTSQIDSVNAEFKEAGAFGAKEGYKVSFLAFDIPGPVSDFYWVKSYRNGVLFNKGNEINLAYDGAYSSGADGLFFIQPIAEGVTPQGEIFKKFDDCRIEIHSINEITYNFLLQVQQQTTNSGLFATTPENVKTNITSSNDKVKVTGWFCMSAVGVRNKIVQ